MSTTTLFALAGLVLGLLFGSFLTVCIARIPSRQSIVRPRSYCHGCGAPIRWYDNIPLLSYLLLHGRCRNCRQRIPIHYPLVEAAVGLWWMLQGLAIGTLFQAAPALHLGGSELTIRTIDYIGLALLGWLLVGLMVIDWQTGLLPDVLTWSGIAAAFFLICVQAVFLGPTEDQVLLKDPHHLRLSSPGSFASQGNVFLTGPEALLFGRLFAVAGVFLLMLFIRWAYKAIRHRDGMGLGDVKLLALIAAFLGFWPAIVALFLGTFLASLYAVVLLARRQADASTRLPFGTFLGLGGLIAASFGDALIHSYMALLR